MQASSLTCADGEASASPPALFANGVAHAEEDLSTLHSLILQDFADFEQRRHLAAPLVPDGKFVQRLKVAKGSPSAGAYSHNLTCLRPVRKMETLERRHCVDRDLLDLRLKRGRACKEKLCSLDRVSACM